MKTEKLRYEATGAIQDIPEALVPAHLANGWVRAEEEPEGIPPETEEEE